MIIAIINQKGGVGKTLLAVHSACWLSRQGRRVGLIDADNAGSSKRWLFKAAPLLPSANCLIAPEVDVAFGLMKEITDTIVADLQPGLVDVAVPILQKATLAILPLTASPDDVLCTKTTIQYLASLRRKTPLPYRVVFNCHQDNQVAAQVFAESMEEYTTQVARTRLHLRTVYKTARAMGVPVWDLKGRQQNMDAVQEMNQLMEELYGQSQSVEGSGRRTRQHPRHGSGAK